MVQNVQHAQNHAHAHMHAITMSSIHVIPIQNALHALYSPPNPATAITNNAKQFHAMKNPSHVVAYATNPSLDAITSATKYAMQVNAWKWMKFVAKSVK